MKKNEILAAHVVTLIGSIAIGGGLVALHRYLESKKLEAERDELLSEIRGLLIQAMMQEEC